MKSQRAIDWSSSAVWGLLAILGLGILGPILWMSGLLEVSSRSWIIAYVNFEMRNLMVADVYHRYFAHGSYRIVRWPRLTQFIIGFMAQTSAQGGIITWGEVHDQHHNKADQEDDPHSPSRDGFWWAHVLWLLAPRPEIKTELPRLRKYPELKWLNEWHMLSPLANALTCFAIDGWAGLFIGFFFSTFVLYNVTWAVNSLVHVFGSRRYDTPDTSRNNWWLSLVLRGEQWHNNHHFLKWLARQGHRWYEIDIGYYLLWLAEKVGWIEIFRPKKKIVA